MAHRCHKELWTLMEEDAGMFFTRFMVLKDIIVITQLFDHTLFVKEQVKIVGESVSKIAVVLEYSFNPLRNGDEHHQKSIFHSPEYSLLINLELVLVLDQT